MNNELERVNDSVVPVLISFSICPFVQRSAVLLNKKSQPFKRINIDLSNKPDWFLQLAPTAKVPVLIVKDGKGELKTVFESAIINEYLDESYGESLLSTDSLAKADQRSWIAFSDSLLFLQYRMLSAETQETYEESRDQMVKELLKLSPAAGKPVFDGQIFSLVDAAYAPLFTRLQWTPDVVELLIEHAERANKTETVQRLLSWVAYVAALPEVKKSVADDFDEQLEGYFSELNSVAMSSYMAVA